PAVILYCAIMRALGCVFLRQRVEAEGIRRIGLKQFIQLFDSLGHAKGTWRMTMFERQWYCAAAARQWPVTAARGRMLLLPAIGAMLLLSGCESTPSTRRQAAATRPALRLTQQVGGTHYRTLVIGDAWLQTF